MSAASEQRPRLYALLRRWPTVLGVVVAALTLSDFDDGREFAIVLLIASVGYLAIAVLERPQATWWVLIGLLAGVVCLRLLNVAPGPVLAVAAVVMTIVGLVRGSLRRLWLPALQAPATSSSGRSPSSLSRPVLKSGAPWLQWVCWRTPFGISFTFERAQSCHPRWPSGAQYWIP